MRRFLAMAALLCVGGILFAANPPASLEDQKIEGLLAHLAAQKDLKFVRNGSTYDSATAVKFLRGKWDRQRDEIKSAANFVDKVASKSSTTGQPYLIRLPDGKEIACRDYLLAQLNQDPAGNITELFETPQRQTTVTGADYIEVCLLEPASGNWDSPPKKYSDYRETAKRKVTAKQQKEIAALLIDDSTYKWAKRVISASEVEITKKGCAPLYHVRIKATKGGEVVEVNFCYFCSDALVVQDGRVVNGAMLGAKSRDLLDIFLTIFPTDSILTKAREFTQKQKRSN
jgi:hypothetical protein